MCGFPIGEHVAFRLDPHFVEFSCLVLLEMQQASMASMGAIRSQKSLSVLPVDSSSQTGLAENDKWE